LDAQIESKYSGQSLSLLLEEVTTDKKAKIFFLTDWTDQIIISNEQIGQPLGLVLDRLFEDKDLSYIEMYPNVIVLVKDPSNVLARRERMAQALSEGTVVDQVTLGERSNRTTDVKVRIRGKVIDWNTDEALVGATIAVNGGEYAVTTGTDGSYALDLVSGDYLLTVSYLGYDDKIINLGLYKSGRLDIQLDQESTNLDEVVIQGKQSVDMSTSDIGKTVLDMTELKRAPALLGSPDIIKQIQSLAGVTSVGEATSGFNVRGGSVDQNLILYDGMPQFNSAHAIGFLNGFNYDAVQNVTFYKGGISARYGGRAASVLDIKSLEGDMQSWSGKAGIGILTSNIMANGPIKKDVSSLTFALRTTYSNWLVRSIDTDFADLTNSTVSFLDGNATYTVKLNDQSKIKISGYGSFDRFGISADTTYQWNNFQIGASWEKVINDNLRATYDLGANTYAYDVINENPRTASQLSYQVSTVAAKAGFDLEIKEHKLNFGVQSNLYRFAPGSLKPTSENSNSANLQLDKQSSLETAFYISDALSFDNRFFVEVGLRIPTFLSFGDETVNIYADGSPRQIVDKIDELDFGKGEVVKTYINLEPRLSLRYMANPQVALKLGYNRIYQYLHLISNTAAVTPVDIWQPSGYYFKPQRSDQVSAGIAVDTKNRGFGISIEGFWKNIDNAIDFKDGARLVLNDHLETELLQGKGRAYGAELSLEKTQGKFTGSLNYTYSRAFRQFESDISGLSINNGNEYAANFDQPHVLNLSWKLNLSRRHFFTGNFVFRKGRPITIPLSAFNLEQSTLAFFSGRNQFRIPDYHRLDLALVIEGNHDKTKNFKSFWSISVYNAYARKNPYSIFFKNSSVGVPRPFRLSVIGTAMPSISYNIEFK